MSSFALFRLLTARGKSLWNGIIETNNVALVWYVEHILYDAMVWSLISAFDFILETSFILQMGYGFDLVKSAIVTQYTE